MTKATDHQEGGSHYRQYAIQPIEYIVANDLSFLAGNVVKYVTRYKDKGGEQDIRKAMHYLELILEFEYPRSVPAEAKDEDETSEGEMLFDGVPEIEADLSHWRKPAGYGTIGPSVLKPGDEGYER
jgi:Protein of unknwon function (DUF3310)